MAKKSCIIKNEKRKEVVKQYADQRAYLKEVIRNPGSSLEVRDGGPAWAAGAAPQCQPKPSEKPVSYFRPDPWIPETIRYVSHRFSFVGLTGGYSGSEKVELVEG